MDKHEFLAMPREDAMKLFRSLPEDEKDILYRAVTNHINDHKLFQIKEFSPTDGRVYFDDIDECLLYLRHGGGIFLDSFDGIREHELAHARCAKMLGDVTVKYSLDIAPGSGKVSGPFTGFYGDMCLPNIAFAAVAVAPKFPSHHDMKIVHESKYQDVEHLSRRIYEWNREDTGLILPMPGTCEI